MKQTTLNKHLALVPRKPRRTLRQLWIDPRAKDDPFFDCDVAVPFCAVERAPDKLRKGPRPMNAFTAALNRLSGAAQRVYYLLLPTSGKGAGGWGQKPITRRAGEIAALAGISERAARYAIDELIQAKFIERIKIEEQDSGGLGFECDGDCSSHAGFGVHYVAPRGFLPLRVKLHPQHASRGCVCYSTGSTKGITCSIPVRQFAIRGVSLRVAVVALYQSVLGQVAFANKKYLRTHIMPDVTEHEVGRILAELPLLGIERTERSRKSSVFKNPFSRRSRRDATNGAASTDHNPAHRTSNKGAQDVQLSGTGRPTERHRTSNLDKRIELNDIEKPLSQTSSPSVSDRVQVRVLNSDSHADANAAMRPAGSTGATGITPAQREAALEVARAQKAERKRAASRAQEAEMCAEASRPKLTEAQEREIVEMCERTNTAQADVLRQCLVSRGDLTPMYVANIRAMSAEDYEVIKPWLEKKAAALAGAARQPASPDFKMTEARVREILSLCEATGADSGKLLAWYKAESFEALTEAQYLAAKSGLEKKAAKAAAAAPVAGWIESPKAPTAPNRENIENGSSRSSSSSKKPD
jgi:hypothetical protein